MIDPLRACPLKCRFCYYLHEDMQSVKPWHQVRSEIDAAVSRGNSFCDVTGGEPMIYPEIEELVRYSNGMGLKPRIITSALSGPRHTQRVIDAGVDTWLISMHGMQETHDWIVRKDGARSRQERFIEQVKGQTGFDINTVITAWNQNEIVDLAEYLVKIGPPRVWNAISFNPHYAWRDHHETRNIVADLRITRTQLNEAIRILEKSGVGCNLRYYPMCAIATGYRRCICNDRQCNLCSGEWDYGLQPKTLEVFLEWGRRTSEGTEEQGEPCCQCDLHKICGGANKYWHQASNEIYGELLMPVTESGIINKEDVYLYRKYNARGFV